MRVQGRAMGSCPFSENHVNVWDAEVEMESMIGDVPWDVGHRSEMFRLVSLNDSYVGSWVSGKVQVMVVSVWKEVPEFDCMALFSKWVETLKIFSVTILNLTKVEKCAVKQFSTSICHVVS